MSPKSIAVKPSIASCPNEIVTCKMCNIGIKYATGDFERHLAAFHDTDVQTYYLTYILPGAEWCMCGCGHTTTWNAKGGGRFADFILGHQLRPNRVNVERDMSFLDPDAISTETVDIPALVTPGTAVRDAAVVTKRDWSKYIHKGVYTSLKSGVTYSYRSRADLLLMQALDNDEIKNTSWERCELIVPIIMPKRGEKRKFNPGYEILQGNQRIILILKQHFTQINEVERRKVDATAMVTGKPVAIVSYQSNTCRWCILWANVEVTL